MVADGRDVSDLFAAVVKNVVSKNVEVSKYSNYVILKAAGFQHTVVMGMKNRFHFDSLRKA